MAFSGNLKEMRGKEPLADWTNLVKPLGGSTGCFTHRTMTAATAHTRRDLKRLKAAARLMFAKFCSTFSTQQTSYPGRQTAVLFPSQTPADPILSYRNTGPPLPAAFCSSSQGSVYTKPHVIKFADDMDLLSNLRAQTQDYDWLTEFIRWCNNQCLDHNITKTRQPAE